MMMNVCVLKDFRVLVHFVKIAPLTIHGGKENITNVLNQIGRNNMSSSMNTEQAKTYLKCLKIAIESLEQDIKRSEQ